MLQKKKDTRPMTMEESETAETKSQNPLHKMEPLPGAVCAQYMRCGKPNCRCANGDLHGPYHCFFYRINGRLIKRYVRKADAPLMMARCLAYRIEQQERRELVKFSDACMRRMRAFLRENSL